MRQRAGGSRKATGTKQSATVNKGVVLSDQAAEYERQFREILEFCPAALLVVDEDGRLLFHNARLREILDYCPAAINVVDEEGRLLFHNWRLRELTGYEKGELELFDTRRFWHDLSHRERIIEKLRIGGGQLLNEEVIWKTKQGEL